jgi:hypothetical protein
MRKVSSAHQQAPSRPPLPQSKATPQRPQVRRRGGRALTDGDTAMASRSGGGHPAPSPADLQSCRDDGIAAAAGPPPHRAGALSARACLNGVRMIQERDRPIRGTAG